MAGRKPKGTTYTQRDLMNMNKEQLAVIRQTLAKRTNARMRSLESTQSSITGQNYAFGAYDIVKHELETDNRKRFSIALKYKGDRNKLLSEVLKLNWFVNVPTSTVSGMRAVEESRVQEFIKGGLDPKIARSKDFYQFLNSRTFGELKMKMMRYKEELYETINTMTEGGYNVNDVMEALQTWLNEEKRPALKDLRQLGSKIVAEGRKKKKGTNTSRRRKRRSKRK